MAISMIKTAEITWRDCKVPVSETFDDPYFSIDNGLEESRYVFLRHNQIPNRWHRHSGSFTVVETGFGTGLNFLATWQAFEQHRQQTQQSDLQLHFISIEKYPLTKHQLQQALAAWPELQPWAEQLCHDYNDPISGVRHLNWPQSGVSLTLYFMDVAEAIEQISAPVHAWYLDGFAPSKNPDMWSESLFKGITRLSQQTLHHSKIAPVGDDDTKLVRDNALTTVATFTAAGFVRRALKGCGFKISKTAGFGRKRDMLTGFYQQCQGPHLLTSRYWIDQYPQSQQSNYTQKPPRTVVIGGGLAGCHSASTLASSGHKVTVIDPLGIAGGASGNPQGGLYVKLAAHEQATHTEFYRQAYEYSLQQVEQDLGVGDSNNTKWQQCGVLQLAYNEKEQRRQQQFIDIKQPPSNFVEQMDSLNCQQFTGSKDIAPGLFFGGAGWVDPRAWCHALMTPTSTSSEHCRSLEQSSDIELRLAALTSLTRLKNNKWRITLDNDEQLDADHIIFASAWSTQDLLPHVYLPGKKIRGQLTYCDPAAAPNLTTVLCGQHYAAPANEGILCIGATYDQSSNNPELCEQDQQANIQHWDEFGEAWHALTNQQHVIGGRVGFRSTTPDYLPMVGPCIDTEAFIKRFYSLAKNAKRWPNETLPVIEGLWINMGHGSRGLASTALSAAILTAQINKSALPCPLAIAEALQPVRFIIRDTIRRRLPEALQEKVNQHLSK